jgi:hypothetical protein
MSGVEKYQEMTKRLVAIQKEEEQLLAEMDAVCLAFTPEERDIVDPEGKKARAKELEETKSMSKLEEKKAEFKKLQQEIWDLERKERLERDLPEMRKLVGTYWKFRNSYSSPKEERDYWWKYRLVIKVTEEGYLEVAEIEITKDDRLGVCRKLEEPWYTMKRFVPSSREEWNVTAAKALMMVKDIF